jgi:ribonuclease P protein component
MERLKRRTDFRSAAKGLRAPGSAFVLQARQRVDESGASGIRVGFTVSRQVGNAVERNRVRRRLREIVRLAAAGSLRDGHDYVLIGRRAALEAPFGDMMRELDAALRRIHALGRDAAGGGAPKRPPHEAGSPTSPRSKARAKPRRNPPRREH